MYQFSHTDAAISAVCTPMWVSVLAMSIKKKKKEKDSEPPDCYKPKNVHQTDSPSNGASTSAETASLVAAMGSHDQWTGNTATEGSGG